MNIVNLTQVLPSSCEHIFRANKNFNSHCILCNKQIIVSKIEKNNFRTTKSLVVQNNVEHFNMLASNLLFTCENLFQLYLSRLLSDTIKNLKELKGQDLKVAFIQTLFSTLMNNERLNHFSKQENSKTLCFAYILLINSLTVFPTIEKFLQKTTSEFYQQVQDELSSQAILNQSEFLSLYSTDDFAHFVKATFTFINFQSFNTDTLLNIPISFNFPHQFVFQSSILDIANQQIVHYLNEEIAQLFEQSIKSTGTFTDVFDYMAKRLFKFLFRERPSN